MHYPNPFSSLEDKLDRVLDLQVRLLELLGKQEKEIKLMALDITALQTAVANETSLDTSAVALIQGLAAQIQALIASSGNTVDPVALQAIVTQMTTNAAALSAALVANTPVTAAQAKATS